MLSSVICILCGRSLPIYKSQLLHLRRKKTRTTATQTEKVITGDEIGVPDLEREVGRNLELDVAQRQNALFLAEHDLLLGSQVLERKQKPPVEVALARQRPDGGRQTANLSSVDLL